MDKQTKTLLGLGAIAVALYFILKPKGSNAQTPPTQTPQSILCNDGQMVLDNPNMPNAKFADPCLNHGGQLIIPSTKESPYYVPCNFNDGDIVEVVGWLNTEFPDYKFSISLNGCMGHSLQSNLDLLDLDLLDKSSLVYDTVQYKGKGRLKSASMVENATRRDESVAID